MKISCPACNARYRIPDDRVKGKNRIFKVKCKRCGSTVRVRGLATDGDLGRQTMPFNLQMPEPAAATPQRVWFVGIDGKQVGPLTEQEVIEHIGAARLGPDDLMWRKGFSAWTPVREVAPFHDLVAASAPSVAQPAGKKHRPRRAQTLELSASMIELLVKLDERTDHGADADAPADGSQPPELPDGEPAAEAEALPPLAEETAPPIPDDEDVAAEAAAATEAITAPPVQDADEQPPVVPVAAKVEATPDTADAAVDKALDVATDRSAGKVSLPGQAAVEAKKGKSKKGKRGKRGRASKRKTPAADDRAALGSSASPSGKIASLSSSARPAAKPDRKKKAAVKPAAAARPGAAKRKGPPPKKKKKGGAGWFIALLIVAAIVAVGIYMGKKVWDNRSPTRVPPQEVAAAPTAPAETPAPEVETPPIPEPTPPPAVDAGAPTAPDAGATGGDATSEMAADAGVSTADGGSAPQPDAGSVAADNPAEAEAAPEVAKDEPKSKRSSSDDAERRRARREARSATPYSKPIKVEPPPPAKKKEIDDIDRLLAQAKNRSKPQPKAKAPPPPPPPPPPVKKKKAPSMDDIDRLLADEKKKKKAPPPPPAAPPKAPVAKGGLTKKQVNAVAAGARSKIMRCYFMHADVDGSETLKVELRIGGDGHVISARVRGKHSSDQVGSCVTSVVKKLRFPRSGGASSKHQVRYTVGG